MGRRINRGDKLPPMHLACSTDDLRPVMNCVYIKDGFATATDAFVLVKYDLRDLLSDDVLADLDGKLIHRELWQVMASVRSYAILKRNEGLVVHKGNIKILITFEDETYPDTESVFRQAFNSERVEIGAIKVNFNPAKLKTVAAILGYKEAINRIQIEQRASSHLICLSGNPDADAIIMPVQALVTLDVPSKFITA